MFKNSIPMLLVVLLAVLGSASDARAQLLEIRQRAGGLILVKAEAGLNLLLRPNDSADVPAEFSAMPAMIVGEEFETRRLAWSGEPLPPAEGAKQKAPTDGVLIESALIGKKRAAISIRAEGLNVLVASLDRLSDQGFIAGGQYKDVHLLVLNVGDSKKLTSARTNMWLCGFEIQQIALNPAGDLPVALMDKFYKTLKRNRTLPTAVLPMIQVPNGQLKFGDRQVVLLKKLE